MRILFNVGHPAQVHLFKNLIWNLEKRGHECKITTIDKEVSLYLLNSYGFDYEIVGTAKSSLFSKAIETIKIEHKLHKIAKSFKPDILVGGVGNIYVTHVGMLMRKPSIVFDDTEHAKIEHLLMDPFASVICTPSCYKKDIGKKQIRYKGYHELAYLHPNYFTPDPAVLDEIGLSKDDTFIILRFVSWSASHDVGQHGIQNKIELAHELEKYGRVFITSEGQLPKELEKYKIKVSPEKLHDLLYYASLYIGKASV
jgi:predicted glycosyltransferase